MGKLRFPGFAACMRMKFIFAPLRKASASKPAGREAGALEIMLWPASRGGMALPDSPAPAYCMG